MAHSFRYTILMPDSLYFGAPTNNVSDFDNGVNV